MTVGYPVDKGQVDMLAGQVSRQIAQWAPQVLKLKEYLDAAPDADLQAPPFNYTDQDVAYLKSGIADLAKLANVFYGKDVVTEAYDFGTFSRRLAGLFV